MGGEGGWIGWVDRVGGEGGWIGGVDKVWCMCRWRRR